jgi:exodeoxyribonuclease V alpha subunit
VREAASSSPARCPSRALRARRGARDARGRGRGATDGDTARVYLPHLAHCESELAKNLAHLLRSDPCRRGRTRRRVEAARRAGIELHENQRDAVLGLLAHPLALLTGGPGVGKTTIVPPRRRARGAAQARVALASADGARGEAPL